MSMTILFEGRKRELVFLKLVIYIFFMQRHLQLYETIVLEKSNDNTIIQANCCLTSIFRCYNVF